MGLRERLAAKRRHEIQVPFRVVDADEAVDADDKLARAKAVHRTARQQLAVADTDEQRVQRRAALDAAQTAVEAAQRIWDRCHDQVTFAPLPPADFEALKAAHADDPSEGLPYNRDTIKVPLIAACAVDSDMSEDDWRQELASGRWSAAELLELYAGAMQANTTTPGADVPKGWRGTGSSPNGWPTAVPPASPSPSS